MTKTPLFDIIYKQNGTYVGLTATKNLVSEGRDYMGYTIIFKTKIVELSDGRIMHLNRRGCNNDTSGRRNDEWEATISTKEEYIRRAEQLQEDSKPMKNAENFDLKIGGRFCTFYDYGAHLKRMLNRAIPFSDFLTGKEFVMFQKINGITVRENGREQTLTMDEVHEYRQSHPCYSLCSDLLSTEEDIVAAIESGERLRICIGK